MEARDASRRSPSGCKQPQPKIGPHLGLCGTKAHSEGNQTCSKMGPPGVQQALPRPLQMPKSVILAQFEHVVTHFGHPIVPKTLKIGEFRTKKIGQKWADNV